MGRGCSRAGTRAKGIGSRKRVAAMNSLLVDEVDGIRRITLNRPERRNAMTPEMQEELMLAMEDSVESDCRVVVFAGAGEAFCAGLDLSALQGMNDRSEAEHTADAK